jgi:predicted amidohydrolase YtcJ
VNVTIKSVDRRSSIVNLVVAVLLLAAVPASAQSPDTVLVNGKILTVDAQSSVKEALAIRDGRVAALGTSADMRKLAGPSTRVIDLQGRTVIPGLIDSHLHAIRAALSFSTEVNWIGVRTLEEALGRIKDAARTMKPGSWLIVAGGWNPQQFKENRRPTQAELVAVAPENPVYVQFTYSWSMMTPLAYKALGIAGESDLTGGGRFERDASGAMTGAIVGPQPAIVGLFDRLPRPTLDEQVQGTKAFFRELNRLGITGVIDPSGNNMSGESYEALFRVWREKALTVRVAYGLGTQGSGKEFEEIKAATALLPMGFGDEMLRFNGIGERITGGMYNNDKATQADKDEYYRVALWAAERGLTLTQHWNRDATVDNLLTIFERVNQRVPLAPLRWSIAHLNDASERTLQRMKALGVGWTVQDAMYFGGEAFRESVGEASARRTPPVVTAKKIGVSVGAGTDAHRVASYNPFTALQWFLDGKTVGGVTLRGPEETPDRAEALRLYTSGSAWFSHDDDVRGSLEVGKLADLAVLSQDYLTVPVDRVGATESLLTMVGGKIVYAAAPFRP